MSRTMPIRRPCVAFVIAALLPAALPASASATHLRARTPASSYPAENSRPRAPSARAHAASRRKVSRRRRAKPRGPVVHGDALRAYLAFEAMQRDYYIQGSGLYAGEPFSYLWPFSQALASTVSLAHVPALARTLRRELSARLVGLQSYLDTDNSGAPEGTYTSSLPAFDATAAPPTGPGGTKYYDDNDWVGIEMVRVYELTHEPGPLGYAEGIMAFEIAGWQSNPALPCPGGIPFSNEAENSDRNTVTTAPAAELALLLYRDTHNPQYLQFAQQAYKWVRSCLLLPSWLYADHIRHGVVDATVWSYNQGTMIGAGTLLYQLTGNAEYLFQARQTARAALEYLTPARLYLENPFFPSVYFRNLMYLDSVTHDPPGARLAQAYADYAWQYDRGAGNVFLGGSPPSAQLLVQASIAQIYALLATPPAAYF
ncbi:MAG TPA: glycoside hydrolase family 76 protein [Solirubrobacteraceae bacterium]|nr:glycoside hydrolase family 76 protein [Solirubrobacteraceae bacterium]